MISPIQMRAARAILDMSQGVVAEQIGIAANTLSKIESGQADPPASRIQDIQNFYEMNGIEFVDGDGAKKKTAVIQTLEGQEGYWRFYDDVYNTVKNVGGEILVSNVDEREFTKWLGDKSTSQRSRMKVLSQEHKFQSKILVKEGDRNLTVPEYAEYRWTPKDRFSEIPFYVYGNKLAIILFEKDNVSIHIIENEKIKNAYKKQFDVIWDQAIHIPDSSINNN